MRADERAMLQALGPAAVALQMAPSPREVLDNLRAAGFAVVPVVPTAEMLRMGDRANNGDVIAPRQANSQADLIWMIMLAAAQEDGR